MVNWVKCNQRTSSNTMPRQRSIKSILVEAVVFIGLLALVGHLSVNFWERFIIQSELTQMKTSLHTLKVTLANIGTAYDNLHKQLKRLVEITEQKHFPNRIKSIVPDHACNGKPIYKLDRRRLHDLQLKAIIQAQNTVNEKKKVNKTTAKHVLMENQKLEAIKHIGPAKNATTITRYPQKSTGVGHQDEFKKTCRHERSGCEKHGCYRDYEQYQVQPCSQWKY